MWEHAERSLTAAGAPDMRLHQFLRDVRSRAFGSFIACDHAWSQTRSVSPGAVCTLVDGVNPFRSAVKNNVFGPACQSDSGTITAISDYLSAQLLRIDHVPEFMSGTIEWDDPLQMIETKMPPSGSSTITDVQVQTADETSNDSGCLHYSSLRYHRWWFDPNVIHMNFDQPNEIDDMRTYISFQCELAEYE